MSWRRLAAPALTLIACGAIWYVYDQIRVLRGTVFWELRYLVLTVAAFAVLSVTERIAARLGPE